MSDIIRLPGGVETNLRRLNVGCGFDIRPDYINVDMNDFHSPDVVADIVDLDGFPTASSTRFSQRTCWSISCGA